MRRIFRRPRAALLALHILTMGAVAAPVPALAMQILDAADHGELVAEISATNVNRIALAGDRIAKVVRSPDGYAVEHDAASGDIYLRPAGATPGTPGAERPDAIADHLGPPREGRRGRVPAGVAARVAVPVAIVLHPAAEIGEPGRVGDAHEDASLLGLGDDIGNDRGALVEDAHDVLPSRVVAGDMATRISSSRSQTARGWRTPRFSTGIPCRRAMRMLMPVPPPIAPPTVQQTTALTGEAVSAPSRIAALRA